LTTIWQRADSGWRPLAPAGFATEKELHDLIEEAPHLLPLAGSPRLTVLGREVRLGNGWADIIAIEPSGRLAIIEIKLARNAEARRAVLAQVLAYAAYLQGLSPAALERDVLGEHLKKRETGAGGIAQIVKADDQEGAFEAAAFTAGLERSLAEGNFRLVFVLDEAPDELVRLVGYLELIAERIMIDLVTVSTYRVGEKTVLVPQRVDPEHATEPEPDDARTRIRTNREVEGSEVFEASIDQAPEAERPKLRRLLEWARSLEAENLVRLTTYIGKSDRWTLLPRLVNDKAGLVTIWNENGAALQFWKSVFERRAQGHLEMIERQTSVTVGQGNSIREVDERLLEALTAAYRGAVGRR
jgi:hypothetical protein